MPDEHHNCTIKNPLKEYKKKKELVKTSKLITLLLEEARAAEIQPWTEDWDDQG